VEFWEGRFIKLGAKQNKGTSSPTAIHNIIPSIVDERAIKNY
jgi:hypothetical protein